MVKFKTNEISKQEFLKINEDDVMFITNPGRMGDEDGSTFIIKSGNELTIYRIDGWMYPRGKQTDISLDDTIKQFPKWYEAWEHREEKNYHGKYKCLYMGFGNGLCVDNSIYSEYAPFLNDLIEKYLENKENKNSLKYAAVFNVWEDAFINMVNDKGYVLGKNKK